MEKPKITVITVSYNAEKTIERTIKSVLKQKYDLLEYIIVDGGSTDGTVDIIRKYDSQITKWVSESDNGIYDAMNKGLRMATGDYVNFLNADDWFLDNVLYQVVKYICYSNADVIYGEVVMDQNGKMKRQVPHPIDSLFWYLSMCHQAVFIRNGLDYFFDLKYRIVADFDMILRFFTDGRSFQFMPVTVACFTCGGVSDNWYEWHREFIDIASKALLKKRDNFEMSRRIILEQYVANEYIKKYDDGLREDVTAFVSEMFESEKRIVLWGLGFIYNRYADLVNLFKEKIEYIVDSNVHRDEAWDGSIEVFHPSKLNSEKDLAVIILTEEYDVDVCKTIYEMELDESIRIYRFVDLKREFIEKMAQNVSPDKDEKMENFNRLLGY